MNTVLRTTTNRPYKFVTKIAVLENMTMSKYRQTKRNMCMPSNAAFMTFERQFCIILLVTCVYMST